jgi:MarR family transcriptional regulator, organic hydroperoxide resistance regulator
VPAATTDITTAWEAFFRTTRRLRARAGREPGVGGLTLPQYHLLEPLRDGGELTVGELAESAGVSAPTASRMLDALERDDRIARRHSDSDRRAVLVSLTAAGRADLQAAHEHVTAFRRRVFERLAPEEREQAAVVLSRLTELLEEQVP